MKTTIYDITEECHGRIIAVSDVHGHGHYLKGLLEKISFTKEDTLVIVGDLIEKGGNSLETVRYCMGLQKENYHIYLSAGNVDVARIGNFLDRSEGHEGRFLGELRWTKDVWRCGFFLEILSEMGVELSQIDERDVAGLKERIDKDYAQELAFLCDRPTIITCGNYIFVHAGIPTDQLETLKDADGFPFLKTDAFLGQKHMFERCVVVGHWPVSLYRDNIDCMDPVFDYERHAVAIDGGCALKKGAQLNALVIPEPYAPMEEITTAAYDGYPVVRARTAQEAAPATVCIRFFDAEVELLSREADELDGQDRLSQEMNDLERKDRLAQETDNSERQNALSLKTSESERQNRPLLMSDRTKYHPLSSQPQNIVTLRHKSSGIVFDVPEKYLYQRGEKLLCSDFINIVLLVKAGETLKLVVETRKGAIVKKGGQMGWYFGELELC